MKLQNNPNFQKALHPKPSISIPLVVQPQSVAVAGANGGLPPARAAVVVVVQPNSSKLTSWAATVAVDGQ